MDDAGLIATWGIAFRIGERVVLTAAVLLIAIVVTVGFWRSIQRVDFQLGRDKLSGAANVVLATPVFALLALIGFAWVSFSNPVTYRVPQPVAAPAAPQVPGPAVAQVTGQVEMIGAVPGSASVDAVDRRRAEALVMALNCVQAAAGDGLSTRETNALDEARLTALRAVWTGEWGDFDALRDWALGLGTEEPDPEAKAVFTARDADC